MEKILLYQQIGSNEQKKQLETTVPELKKVIEMFSEEQQQNYKNLLEEV